MTAELSQKDSWSSYIGKEGVHPSRKSKYTDNICVLKLMGKELRELGANPFDIVPNQSRSSTLLSP